MSRLVITLSALLLTLAVVWSAVPGDAPLDSVATWQQLASPGPLAPSHRFLESDCMACHTPVEGVRRASCVVCHANETLLLQRQPTAFHASISSCVECHAEHGEGAWAGSAMDHEQLARIGLGELVGEQGRNIRSWVLGRGSVLTSRQHPADPELAPSAAVQSLDCVSCHSRQDPHFGLMGQDCVACHATQSWNLAAFRHPSPVSRDCAQCHQAPPSHYMGHFKMVSARIARKPHADVSQCFECHRTTAWTDIPGIGHYKHH